LLAYESHAGSHDKFGDKEIGVADRPVVGADPARSRATGYGRLLPYPCLGGIMFITFVSALAALASNHGEEPAPPGTAMLGRFVIQKVWLPSRISDGHFPGEPAGQNARVRYRLQVNTKGNVSDCRISESSGNAMLDANTCRMLVSRARFVPARDAAGRPVQSERSDFLDWVELK
jgi:TonB family protein